MSAEELLYKCLQRTRQRMEDQLDYAIEATEVGRRRSLIDEKNKEKGFKRRAQAGPGGPRRAPRPAQAGWAVL